MAPREAVDNAALEVMHDRRVAVLPHLGQTARPGMLRSLLVVQAPTARPPPTTTPWPPCSASTQTCTRWRWWTARPVALINRQQFMNHYATLYFREVHGRKPCLAFANLAPRVVELDCDVDQLVGILTSQDQRYLSDGFIVTDNGRYLGLGTGDQLVRAVTETRIEAARHANPLTFLPGNIPISLHIQRLLESGTEFVACYADLNHFKPFNDHYGYWRGDQMIRLVARLAGALRCARDFVGHVGGDDFMLIFQSSNWLQRCKNIVDEFAREAVACLTTAPAGRRHPGRGPAWRAAVLSVHHLAIGAVRITPGRFRHAEEVANLAAVAKHEAKQASTGVALHGGFTERRAWGRWRPRGRCRLCWRRRDCLDRVPRTRRHAKPRF
jgi:diguanylate cyclase (GGDEF)-like protein